MKLSDDCELHDICLSFTLGSALGRPKLWSLGKLSSLVPQLLSHSMTLWPNVQQRRAGCTSCHMHCQLRRDWDTLGFQGFIIRVWWNATGVCFCVLMIMPLVHAIFATELVCISQICVLSCMLSCCEIVHGSRCLPRVHMELKLNSMQRRKDMDALVP